VVYIHSGTWFIKKHGNYDACRKWMEPENIMFRKIRQTQKDKFPMVFSHMQNLDRKNNMKNK
jgi:hypothetical protein